MLITNGRMVQTGTRRRTISRQVSLGPISLRLVTVVIIAAAALVALAQSTQSATKNYQAEELKAQVAEKQKDVEEKQFEAARLNSLKAITNSETPTPVATPILEEAKQINFLPSTNANLSQLPTDSSVE